MPISADGGTDSGTVADDLTPSDPDLAYLIDRWPGLPESTKQQILALARSAAAAAQQTPPTEEEKP